MKNMKTPDILKELTSTTAVSGHEELLARRLKEIFMEFCEEIWIDKFYNVVGKMAASADENGYIDGRKMKILVMAHMDEIGLMVKSIDEKGFIRVTSVGGVDPKILPAHEVIIHGTRDIPGIIGAKPPHLLKPEEANKSIKIQDLAVDTGMCAEDLKKVVSIGDLITLDSEFTELKNGKFSAKTVDNRSGVTALIETMKELTGIKHGAEVYFVASTQEETRLTGAIISSYAIEPDAAIVIDACHGNMPDTSKEDTYTLGKGPAIGIGPVLDRKMSQTVINVAKDENIPYQIDVEPSDTGTEAWATQVSRAGIPTVLLSIPVRYMHTAVETVQIDDIKNTGRLAARFIARLTRNLEVM